MIRVLLVIPPLVERSYSGKFMGVDYLAAALLACRHKVKILDLDIAFTRKNDVLKVYKEVLSSFEPQLIGITNMSIQNDIANYLAWFAKKELPNAVVIKGGFHEITGWKFTLELHHDYVDACVIGEGEITIQEIAQSIEKGRWEERKVEIPSVAYWDGNKAILNDGWMEVNPNLFIPARLLHYPEYNFEVFDFAKTAQVMTVRGCPFQCAFCSEAFFPERIHWREIDHIVRELEWLRNNGYKAIYFDDPTFTLKPSRVLELIKEIKKRDFIWGCNTRVDLLSEEIIKQMGSAGCVYLFCGIESLIPETLLAMNKTRDPNRYLEKIPSVYKWLYKAGISPSVFLIFGNVRRETDGRILPEKWEDIEYTLHQVVKLDINYISMNILRLLPGTYFSSSSQYALIRPIGGEPVHAGYYDMKWYLLNGKKDIRSSHPIYRCFEGARSVNSNFASPYYVYRIIRTAIDIVNLHNSIDRRQIKIVVDPKAYEFFYEKKVGGKIEYEITPFEEIPPVVETVRLLEDWKDILREIT